MCGTGELAMQPSLCDLPFALHGSNGYAEDGGNFVQRQTAEESHFHDAAETRVPRREANESLVHCDHFVALVFGDGQRFFEMNCGAPAAALCGPPATRVIDQDVAHRLRRHRVEVGAAQSM